jgi:translation initiation factor IF-2
VVLESSIEKGRGAVATVLVKRGTLKVGDADAGRRGVRPRPRDVRRAGQAVEEAGPSTPVQVLGLSNAAERGRRVRGDVESEKKAREVALYRQGKFRDVRLAKRWKKLEDVFSQMGEEGRQSVQLLVKADVQGSAEALRDALTEALHRRGHREGDRQRRGRHHRVRRHAGGRLEGADHRLQRARRRSSARAAVKDQGVDVRYYSIIYEAIDDVKAAISGMLKRRRSRSRSSAWREVREVFRSSKFGTVAGCLVVEATCIKRNNPMRVLRDNVVIFQGELESLQALQGRRGRGPRRHRVRHRRAKGYNDVRAGDQIECFERYEVARTFQQS